MKRTVLAFATCAAAFAAYPLELASTSQAQAPAAQTPRRRQVRHRPPPASPNRHAAAKFRPRIRAKIEAALPAKALASPKKPRKLLVFDRQGIFNGRQYGGHASIPHGNLVARVWAAAATLGAASAPVEAQAPATASQTPGAPPQTPQPRPRREVSPEDRTKIEAALPAKALARPKKPRKLLVFDRQGIYNGRPYGGHASIPHANLAAQLMGEKTGAFTATQASEPGAISAANLQQYDAVYLNNTVGDVFDTPEMRAALRRLRRQRWRRRRQSRHQRRLAELDRVRRDSRRDRRLAPRADRESDDQRRGPHTSSHARAFDGKPFEYVDEFYRLGPPYSRDKVRVLLSIDPIATDMMQGRCYGQCLRDDNDYPVAWIRQHGKGARLLHEPGTQP